MWRGSFGGMPVASAETAGRVNYHGSIRIEKSTNNCKVNQQWPGIVSPQTVLGFIEIIDIKKM